MHSRPQKRPINYVVSLCKRVVAENRDGNLHFFVNSVKFIVDAIKKAGLTPEQVKIVCSNSDENRAKLPREYAIEEPAGSVKKVNFYTSTAFEGCDIYDEKGRIYIVSDSRRAQTMVDISTLFIQICGRIRNSIYNAEVTHIHSTTRYSEDLTLDEFVARTQKTLTEATEFADDINGLAEKSRAKILSTNNDLAEKYVK